MGLAVPRVQVLAGCQRAGTARRMQAPAALGKSSCLCVDGSTANKTPSQHVPVAQQRHTPVLWRRRCRILPWRKRLVCAPAPLQAPGMQAQRPLQLLRSLHSRQDFLTEHAALPHQQS